jgi:hypothetical protein
MTRMPATIWTDPTVVIAQWVSFNCSGLHRVITDFLYRVRVVWWKPIRRMVRYGRW